MSRPSWDEYFLDLTDHVGSRATCDRGKSGAVITRDRQIISTGYVGSPPGAPHCDDVGHLLRAAIDEDGVTRDHCMRTIHAEQNAILQAAKRGASLEGVHIYCTMEPCRTCAMFIVSVGISRVMCRFRYHAAIESRQILRAGGVSLEVLTDDLAAYARQSE